MQDWKDEEIDVITIGDSFSNGDTQGLNAFYQDYIATYNNKNVLNIPRDIIDKYNFIEIISMLNNSNILDKIKPKYILIQSVERFSIERFSNDIDFSAKDENNTLYNTLKNSRYYFFNSKDYNKQLDFININNFRALRNNILFKLYGNEGLFSGVYIEPLKKELFSSQDKSSLLFLKQDIDNIILSTKEKVEKLNYNFNILAEILEKKGIKLYFMPIVDKYNLYSKYLESGGKYPKSKFFELLRKFPQKYTLIDTKKILLEELAKDKKDIYYSDDTHWSYKASEVIFKKVRF
ncbi:MAG: hypothetical protein C0625_12430 [Arcobacter sp.]|nr:MAG: hypothetical protein C0625_12430 [Arcobacter sp.]